MTEPVQLKRIGIVGVGLLGGSVARGVGESFPNAEIVGSSRNPETRQYIVASGMVHHAASTAQECAEGCDLVVIASPVSKIADTIPLVAEVTDSHAIITDVGSTKQAIVDAAQRCSQSVVRFVGSHPIAGSEKTGPRHATGDLFRGKLTVTTPTSKTDPERHRRIQAFWRALGSRVVQMSPAEHDQAFAAVSHMPHLVSAALAQSLSPEHRDLVGSGFRDATRIAAGDPNMWRQIVQTNAQAILSEMDQFSQQIEEYRTAIAEADWDRFEQLLATAQQMRWSVDKTSGVTRDAE